MAKQQSLHIHTHGRAIYDITDQINTLISDVITDVHLCHLFCQHTSASLLICENFDHDVKIDIETFLADLVKDGDPRFKHRLEGKDDMPAHIRTMLTDTHLMIPVQNGQLALGQWQGIGLYEHRYQAHQRNIVVTLL